MPITADNPSPVSSNSWHQSLAVLIYRNFETSNPHSSTPHRLAKRNLESTSTAKWKILAAGAEGLLEPDGQEADFHDMGVSETQGRPTLPDPMVLGRSYSQLQGQKHINDAQKSRNMSQHSNHDMLHTSLKPNAGSASGCTGSFQAMSWQPESMKGCTEWSVKLFRVSALTLFRV